MPFSVKKIKSYVPISIIVVGWIWTIFVARYDYQRLEDSVSNQQFISLAVFITLIASVILIKPVLHNLLETKKIYQRIFNLTFSIVVVALLSFVAITGYLLTLNAVFDYHEKITYKTKVKNAHITHSGRKTRYWIVVEKVWQNNTENYSIFIPRSKYLELNLKEGDQLKIILGRGALGFPWIKAINKEKTLRGLP